MPDRPWLVDTSVAVALVVADHEHHGAVVSATQGRTLGLAGHAAFETFSVITRLPPPARRSAQVVARLLHHNFPSTRFLGESQAVDLLDRVGTLGIAGGAVYDALVGAAAAQHHALLLTRDRRAADTYGAIGVEFELLD